MLVLGIFFIVIVDKLEGCSIGVFIYDWVVIICVFVDFIFIFEIFGCLGYVNLLYV